MSEPRWKGLQSGAWMIVCAFTFGDGHVCDQQIGIGSTGGPLVSAPRGWYYTPALDGIHELRRTKTPRRPMPEAKQPTDENDQPMWPLTRWGSPTGLTAKHIIGEQPILPARIRCPECRQVRTLTPERSGV